MMTGHPPVGATTTDATRTTDRPSSGYTVADLTTRWRVGSDKIHRWIRGGQLKAINTAGVLCGRPRWIILPEAVAEFERGRTSAPAPKRTKRTKRTNEVDYYPD
jgi:hypothetical protein